MDHEAQSGPTSRIAEAEAETVVIQVPADVDYLAVIRSASAHIATRLGCTLRGVADLRLAVDEACSLLLRHTVRDEPGAGAGDLVCRFVLDGSALRVMLSRQARNAAAPLGDDFGWVILSALVDDIVWRVDGPMVHVEILKHRVAEG